MAANIVRLNFTGVETSAAWRWRHQLFDVSYTGLRGVSELLPENLYEVRLQLPHPFRCGFMDRHAVLVPSRLGPGSGAMERRARDPYGVWDLYLARNRGPVRPFVQFTNLANTRYQEILSIPLPGRAVLGGVEIVIR
ncbi:MAG: hypothetical protein QM757_05940 [Paludibaculum sp.]